MGIENLNLQPLLDLIGRAGQETSEYKAARAAGRAALTLFLIGLIGFLAGTVTNVFGASSKVGVAASAVAAIAGVVANAAVSLGLSAARADTKQAAASVIVASIPPTAGP